MCESVCERRLAFVRIASECFERARPFGSVCACVWVCVRACMWCVNGAREKAEKNIVSVRAEVSLRWPG